MTLRVQRVRHRAGADGEDLQARLPGLRGADHLRRPRLRRGQEDRVARRRRRAVGAAEVPVQRVNAFLRLLEYARPLSRAAGRRAGRDGGVRRGVGRRGRADPADLRRGAAEPARTCGRSRSPSSASTSSRAIGAYLSGYLMTDVGQRVVRDLRNVLFRHILGQSAAFFSLQTTGRLMSRITNDVGAGAARRVGDDRRPDARVAGARRLRRRCSFYYDARLAIVCLTGAPLVVYPLVRLGPARAPDDAAQPGSARADVARQRRGVHRPPHRQGVRRRGARAAQVRAALAALLPHQHEGDERRCRVLPPLMEFIGGVAFVAALWYGSQEIAAGRLTTGRVHRRSSRRCS